MSWAKTTGPMNKNTIPTAVSCLLLVSIAVLLFTECLMNLTPPISRDALIHHLAIPKLWIEHGGLYEISWAKYSYYPMNIDLLYLACLYFKKDIAPKFIHLAFALGTGLLIYIHLKMKFSRNWGLLGVLIFLSTPIIIRLSTSAYVDLGLIFFTTASVLSFVQWQDGKYKQMKWFIFSAVSMGLAAGCKYNGLIPWVFVNLMLIFYFARDTQKQVSALNCGLLFFALSLVTVSPWYIKNYLFTSNPIYPLFDNIFNPSNHPGSLSKGSGMGFFQKRELMYGETFWETLFIPLRMFFQGHDNSDQYFDGVLNPILIVMAPFAFLNKRLRRNTLFFTAFTAYFLICAFFLTVPRVRYILPVVPLLAIVTTMGIKALIDHFMQRKGFILYAGIMVTIVITTFFLGSNWLYLKNHFAAIKPIKYISDEETKDQFLARHIGSYPATEYINKNLPTNAKIFLMFMAGRGYYLDRDYCHESSFGMGFIEQLVKTAAVSDADFIAYLQSQEFSHIFMRTDLFEKYLADNFKEETILRFLALKRKYWKQVYESKGYMVLGMLK